MAAKRRFDHEEAREFWLGLSATERTFKRVAEEYGVSPTAVRKVAEAKGWAHKLEEIHAIALES